jgi:bifunctional ADP-heptose synthase (sugar kinase/adenylyltransferase)
MNTQQQKRFKILLIGDACIDEYLYGSVERLSPEAPVPIFKLEQKETKPGMASNVGANLEKFNVDVLMITGEKSTKTRLIDIKSKQHIVRIDNDLLAENPLPLDVITDELLAVDCVVISDYNKGLVSYEFVEGLVEKFNGPIFVDTKKTDLARFKKCFVKINNLEYSLAKTLPENLIVTMGDKGVLYNNETYQVPNIPVTDVTGAGDTFLSSLAYFYLVTSDMSSAIQYAIKAASVTVQHTGVYAPTLEEICQ